MKHSYKKALMCLLLFCSAGLVTKIKAQGPPVTVTFTHTGSMQTFTIPPCVGSMTILAIGAGGGSGQANTGPGLGAAARAIMTGTPGQVMYINVGGQGSLTAGGFNGGGAGGVSASSSGGGGGGASDIRLGNNLVASRIIVAAGGGGSGGNGFGGPYGALGANGGAGTAFTSASGFGGAGAPGCASGSSGGEQGGAATGYGSGGGGAGFSSGGSGGGQPSASAGGFGCTGTLGSGGAGGGTSFICGGVTGGQNGGGGGGGGYYGGGGGMSGTGGCNGGGGGGSSWTNNSMFSTITYTGGLSAGHGSIFITYAFNGSIVSGVASPSAICTGSTSTITASGATTYTWSDNSNGTSLVVSPGTTTSYSVTGTNSIGCVSSAVITVTVDTALPTLTVSNTASLTNGICPNSTVNLTASGATGYSWVPAISNGVTFSPINSATYVVTGYNGCGSTTAATSVSVHPIPPIVATISQPSICSGNTVITTATGAQTYLWSHGVPNGQAVYPFATTMYTVVGTSVLGCTAQAMIGVTVETTPILAPIATPTLICMGGSGTVAVSGASNYTWLPVPANNFAGSNNGTITITPTVTATYTVVKANSNCTDTKMITVYVNALPNVFAITSHTVVCAGSSATLSGGGASSYTWTPSSFNLVGNNVVVSPIAATIYTCTGNDGTCTAVYTVAVGTNPVPIIQATASTPSLCVGGSVTLNATGALTYTWNPGGQGAQITDTPLIPTNYIVSGTNIYTCTSQAQVPVIVYPNPTVNAVPNKTLVCLNGPSTITASGANSYVWTTGSLTHTTLVFPPATTVYTVTGTYSNSGCSSSKTVMVQAYTPVTGINGPTAVCIGSGITISSAPANSYTWTVGGNFLSNQASVLISPTVNTTYMLGTTSTSNQVSCVGGNSVNIQVNALPVITASAVGNRTLICKGESVDLFASGGLTYVWTFQGNTSMITVSPPAQTTYTVEGTDLNNCKNTTTITVKVSGCPGFEELSSNVANIRIYPNPSNGEFNISSTTDVELQLINELGQIVMEVKLNADNSHKADVKGLSGGIYFLSDKTGTVKQKLIIQN